MRELDVELLQRVGPVQLPFLHLVQLLFHARRVGDVEDVAEVLHQQVAHHHAEFGGMEAALLLLDVLAVLNDGEDGGVGRGPADALLFQRLDQRGFVVARRGLGEVLLRQQLVQLELFADLHLRQTELQFLVFLHLRLLVLALFIDGAEAVELLDGTGGAQQVVAGRDVDGGLVEDRRVHLRRHKALPDQLVELEFIRTEISAARNRACARPRWDGWPRGHPARPSCSDSG